jgi:hypothetical protein
MPIIDGPGNVPRRPRPKPKTRPYSPPPSRSDAAQRKGKSPVKRRTSPNPKPYSPPDSSRSDAAQRSGARSRDSRRSDAAQGNSTSAASYYQNSPAHRAARKAAREARLFGPVSPRELARYKAAEEVRRAQARDRLSSALSIEGLTRLADALSKRAYVPNTGGGPNLGGRGTFGAPRGAAAAVAPQQVRFGDSEAGRNLVRDLITFPVLAPAAIYEVGAAGVEAARGDTDRAEKLARGLMEGVLGNAVQGDWAGALQAAEDHPLFAVQELRGAKAVAGRSAGAVMRSGVAGERARQAASTARADREIAPGVFERQHYSPDVLTKAAQVALGGKGQRSKDHLMRKRADFISDRANNASRVRREQETHEARQAMPERGGARRAPERDVVALAMQGVVRSPRTFKADLQAELQRLASASKAGDFRSKDQLRANRAQQQTIRAVLKDPKALANAEEVFRAARDLGRRGNELEGRGIKLNALDGKAAERSKLFPYAQAHMGARYEKGDPKATKKAVAQARREVERARGAKEAVLARLKADGVKAPTKAKEYRAAAQRVTDAQAALKVAQQARKSDGPALRDANGRTLTNDQIRAHMRANDVDPDSIAYLPHRPDVRGARAYYQTAFAGRRNLDGGKRTGEAFRKGTYGLDRDLPVEHLNRLRGVVGRIEEHDQLIKEVGIRHKDGRAFTWKEAEAYAENHKGTELVPFRAAPGSYNTKRLQDILEKQDPDTSPDLSEVVHEAFLQRFQAPHPADRGTQNVVLIPKEIKDRLTEQMKTASNLGRAGNSMTNLFRRTVLPFSVKWLVGNLAEANLRLLAVGAGPNAYRIGKKLLREIDKMDADQALAARAALVGGLQFGQRGLTVKRPADQFTGGWRKPAAAVAVIGKLPMVRQLKDGFVTYTDSVFALNRLMESDAQTMALGKWAKREMQEFTGSWAKSVKAQEKAVADVAKGLLNTKNQVDAAKYIDETLGQYSRFSPTQRRIFQSVAPFAPWYLNAIRFVTWTLPAKHPVKTALLMSVERTIQEDWEAQHKNVPPGSLKSALPDGEGGLIDIARYGPFGAFTAPLGGDVSGLADPLFPQASTPYGIITYGANFTGRDLKLSSGEEADATTRILLALNAAGESFLPLTQIVRRVREGGATPYDDSTVLSPKTKPGTDHGSAADRILNPVRPIRLGSTSSGEEVVTPPQESPVPVDPRQRLLERRAALATRSESTVSPTVQRLLERRQELAARRP